MPRWGGVRAFLVENATSALPRAAGGRCTVRHHHPRRRSERLASTTRRGGAFPRATSQVMAQQMRQRISDECVGHGFTTWGISAVASAAVLSFSAAVVRAGRQ